MVASRIKLVKKISYLPEGSSQEVWTKGIETPQEQIFNAITYGQIEEVKRLVANQPQLVNGQYKKTPNLYQAIQCKHKDIVELLIEKGAAIDTKDDDGNNTVLHSAIQCQSKDIVELLIDKKANIESRDDEGKTPLHHGVYHNNIDAMKLLLDEGAEINIQDNEGRTPLHLAADRAIHLTCQVEGIEQHFELEDNGMACFLLDNKAKVDIPDHDGNTALYYAALRGNSTIIKLLLEKDSSIDAQCVNQRTPLDLLLPMGCDIETISQFLNRFASHEIKLNQKNAYIILQRLETEYIRFNTQAEVFEELQENLKYFLHQCCLQQNYDFWDKDNLSNISELFQILTNSKTKSVRATTNQGAFTLNATENEKSDSIDPFNKNNREDIETVQSNTFFDMIFSPFKKLLNFIWPQSEDISNSTNSDISSAALQDTNSESEESPDTDHTTILLSWNSVWLLLKNVFCFPEQEEVTPEFTPETIGEEGQQ
ncbi:MAG: ankyrin repeat domain-containing protein [Rickettsiaceae bacterium]|nr:ankyrin repeat domain-containing protein [Rickettsiaceae bacterium]